MREHGLPHIRVERLTRDLAQRLHDDSILALTGDGGCSAKNMHTTCFASERCARGGGGGAGKMALFDLLHASHAYVAYTDMDATHTFRGMNEMRFVGCVSAGCCSHARGEFPHIEFRDGALVLSNLCVADAYRKHGVGRRLIDKILGLGASETNLLIARSGLTSSDPEVLQVFNDRVARLEETYSKLHFHPVCKNGNCALMRYCPPERERERER